MLGGPAQYLPIFQTEPTTTKPGGWMLWALANKTKEPEARAPAKESKARVPVENPKARRGPKARASTREGEAPADS